MTEDLKSGLPVVKAGIQLRASGLHFQGSNRLASLHPKGGYGDEISSFSG